MCTLRNFPHITDHCIEWARDQFELLFKKLGKNCENYLSDPTGFESETLGKSEVGMSIFDTRAMISFFKCARERTLEGCVSAAYDLFHFFFRDRILDLQSQFPRDAKLKSGAPFWGEKKRYPTAAVFKPEDESHRNFLVSTTVLLAANLGVIAPRVEGGPAYGVNQEAIINIAKSLSEVEYIHSPVGGIEEDKDSSKAETAGEKAGEKELKALFSTLREVSASTSLGKVDIQDFEKDDDLNFHIAFMTSCANLRCDNYQIKRTDFHSCKVIAGRIIPALATTTTAVCGLVMFELFKVRMDCNTDAFMSRLIGLAGNTFTSFSQDPPKKFKSHIKKEDPPAKVLETIEGAYDDKGRVKEEFKIKTPIRSYPEGHSCWNSIKCSGSLTIRQFIDWLASEHKLNLDGWFPTIGTKPNKCYKSLKVYPPAVQLDVALLPPLTATQNEMIAALRANPVTKKDQQMYVKLWRDLRSLPPLTLSEEEATAAIRALPGDAKYHDELIDLWTASQHAGHHVAPYALAVDVETTTLKDVFKMLETTGMEAVARKELVEAAISHLDQRRIVTMGKNFGILCSDIASDESIEHLCDIEVTL